MSWWDFAKKLWETKFGKILVGSIVGLGIAVFLEAFLLSGTIVFSGKISMAEPISFDVPEPGIRYFVELRRRQDPNRRSLKYIINDPNGNVVAQDTDLLPNRNDLYITFMSESAGNYNITVEPNDNVSVPVPIQIVENDRRVLAPFLNKYHIRIFQPKSNL